MENITAVIRGRRSVRTFDGRTLMPEDLQKLQDFAAGIENPYGIPVKFRFLDKNEHGLTCPVVTGTDLYIAGKAAAGEHVNEAFGYSFEMLVLYAQSLGIGTVWLGGTMDRAAFEKAMELQPGEIMPCASPLGYAAQKFSLRETMMRKTIRADSRDPFGDLFFDGEYGAPLTPDKAGRLAPVLELVRWAPSAVNRQPWRVVVTDAAAHFYLKRAKGFSKSAALDMQKIDLGIAMSHFVLAAQEQGIDVTFTLCDPGFPVEAGAEYIATFMF